MHHGMHTCCLPISSPVPTLLPSSHPILYVVMYTIIIYLFLLSCAADTCTPYGNTRAFLDYRLMGFREAVAEMARYMVSVEGMDVKDPLRLRVLNHLENYLAQRELAINAAIAASTHKPQATVNALFPAQPLPGFVPPQMAPPLNKDYMMTQKFMSFTAPTTAAPMPPFHIPVSTMTPIAFHPALGVTSIPVAMPTSAATKVESPTPSSPASGYKSPSSASSPRAPFRPWLTDDKMT